MSEQLAWLLPLPSPMDAQVKLDDSQLVIARARRAQNSRFVETSDNDLGPESKTQVKVTDREKRKARFRKMVEKIAALGTPRPGATDSGSMESPESSSGSPSALLPYHCVMTQRLMASSTGAIAFDLHRAFSAIRNFVQKFAHLGKDVFKNLSQSSVSSLFDLLRWVMSEAQSTVESMTSALRKMSKVDGACAFRDQLPVSSSGNVTRYSAEVSQELSELMMMSRDMGDKMARETFLLERMVSAPPDELESLHGVICIFDVFCRLTAMCDAFRDTAAFSARLRVFFEKYFEESEVPVQLNIFEEMSICQFRMVKLTLHQFVSEARMLVKTVGDHMQYLSKLPYTAQ